MGSFLNLDTPRAPSSSLIEYYIRTIWGTQTHYPQPCPSTVSSVSTMVSVRPYDGDFQATWLLMLVCKLFHCFLKERSSKFNSLVYVPLLTHHLNGKCESTTSKASPVVSATDSTVVHLSQWGEFSYKNWPPPLSTVLCIIISFHSWCFIAHLKTAREMSYPGYDPSSHQRTREKVCGLKLSKDGALQVGCDIRMLDMIYLQSSPTLSSSHSSCAALILPPHHHNAYPHFHSSAVPRPWPPPRISETDL